MGQLLHLVTQPASAAKLPGALPGIPVRAALGSAPRRRRRAPCPAARARSWCGGAVQRPAGSGLTRSSSCSGSPRHRNHQTQNTCRTGLRKAEDHPPAVPCPVGNFFTAAFGHFCGTPPGAWLHPLHDVPSRGWGAIPPLDPVSSASPCVPAASPPTHPPPPPEFLDDPANASSRRRE